MTLIQLRISRCDTMTFPRCYDFAKVVRDVQRPCIKIFFSLGAKSRSTVLYLQSQKHFSTCKPCSGGHVTFMQHRTYVDATSWGSIDVNTKWPRRHVSASDEVSSIFSYIVPCVPFIKHTQNSLRDERSLYSFIYIIIF